MVKKIILIVLVVVLVLVTGFTSIDLIKKYSAKTDSNVSVESKDPVDETDYLVELNNRIAELQIELNNIKINYENEQIKSTDLESQLNLLQIELFNINKLLEEEQTKNSELEIELSAVKTELETLRNLNTSLIEETNQLRVQLGVFPYLNDSVIKSYDFLSSHVDVYADTSESVYFKISATAETEMLSSEHFENFRLEKDSRYRCYYKYSIDCLGYSDVYYCIDLTEVIGMILCDTAVSTLSSLTFSYMQSDDYGFFGVLGTTEEPINFITGDFFEIQIFKIN